MLSEKKKPKGYILYNSIYLSSWKRQYCGTKNPISSCHGLGPTTKRHEETFGVMKMLHILIVVVVHRCIPLPKLNKQNTTEEFILLYVCFISINLTLKKLHKKLYENVGKWWILPWPLVPRDLYFLILITAKLFKENVSRTWWTPERFQYCSYYRELRSNENRGRKKFTVNQPVTTGMSVFHEPLNFD